MKKIPVYVVSGFLDAGKTTYISDRIKTDRFHKKGRTLIIALEEGEQSYDCSLMAEYETDIVYPEDIHDEKKAISELVAGYTPDRIFIENNVMKQLNPEMLPCGTELVSWITIVDGSTLPLYFENMKQLFADTVKHSELVIFNRTERKEDLAGYAHGFRLMNERAGFLWESPMGYHEKAFDDVLPYNMDENPVEITESTYSFWYLDAVARPERYDGRRIRMTVQAGKKPGDEEGCWFFAGRQVMTCCINDLQFLGFDCRWEDAARLSDRAWVELTAAARLEKRGPYGVSGLVLYAEELKPVAPLNPFVT